MFKLPIIFIFSFCFLTQVRSQSFSISVKNHDVYINAGDSGFFDITAAASGGFKASIDLFATSTCITSMNFRPSVMNSPYSGSKLEIGGTANLYPGVYNIYLQGANGSVQSYDTCRLHITSASNQWIIYNDVNSGLPNKWIQGLCLDSQNNLWFTNGSLSWPKSTSSSLSKFNGSTWEIWTYGHHIIKDYCGKLISDNADSSIPHGIGECYTWFDHPLLVDNTNAVWTYAGYNLVKFDGKKWSIFSKKNTTGMPDGPFSSFALNSKNEPWISTEGLGLAHLSGNKWTTYNTSNSSIPSDNIRTVYIENDSSIWIGTMDAGVAKFDGKFWTNYNTGNSKLFANYIYGLNTDSVGRLWICGKYLSILNDTVMTTYTNTNTNLPADPYFGSITFGQNGTTWLTSTDNGFFIMQGTSWKQYTRKNSPLPENVIGGQFEGVNQIIVSRKTGEVWISKTGGGLVRLNAKAALSITTGMKNDKISGFNSSYIFPNPARNSITFSSGEGKIVGIITLRDIWGRIYIATTTSEEKSVLDISSLSNGIYFLNFQSNKGSWNGKFIKE